MIEHTRRSVLGGIAGGTLLFAGCTGTDPTSSGFTRTDVEGRELIVEFDEELEPDGISVVDPDGESFAETEISPGATRATFDVEMPYEPGEYDVLAINGDDVIAETSQEIRPDLEIVEVGVGANRMEEMDDGLGVTKESEAIITIRNSGTGPEEVAQLLFLGEVPNPTDPEDIRVGIFDPEDASEAWDPLPFNTGEERTVFSSSLPFYFGGDGVECEPDPQSGEMEVQIRGEVIDQTSETYPIKYTGSDTYDACDIALEGPD